MARKLFCQRGPWAYRISQEKEILRRKMKDLSQGPFAKTVQKEPLPQLIYDHKSLILAGWGCGYGFAAKQKGKFDPGRSTGGWDSDLSRGDLFLLASGGRCTRRKGYQTGMTIGKGQGRPGRGRWNVPVYKSHSFHGASQPPDYPGASPS